MKRVLLVLCGLTLTLATLLSTRPARAQGAVDTAARETWSVGAERPFAASTVDFGYVYLRPRLSLGYGRPHAEWVGVDLNPIFQNTGLGAYGGLRASLPFADLRVGVRGFYAFQRSYLTPQDSYSRLDLETTNGGHAAYATYEAEITAGTRLGPGEVGFVASASSVEGVPRGQYVFEETLHAIVDPPWVLRARVGYSFFVFPNLGRASLGPAFEALYVPSRTATTLRAGLLLRIVVSRSVEVRGSFVPAVVSPDSIGIVGGDFSELGLRYRWATEGG
jgi:hypothetical protein